MNCSTEALILGKGPKNLDNLAMLLYFYANRGKVTIDRE